jgi:hypothetical protein
VDSNKGLPKRSAKKNVFKGRQEYFDAATGAKVGEKLIYRSQAIKTIFVTMYLNDDNMYEFISGLGNPGKVLAYILKDYNDKTGMFYFSNTTKELMIKELKLSIGTVRGIVKEFATKKTIIHVGGSEYMVNPRLFYKGAQINYDAQVEAFDGLHKISSFKEIERAIESKVVKA